jgi:YD repeat-containing protein
MLVVNIDSTGSNRWANFYRYNSAGQPIWMAYPSAVALPASLLTLEAFNDLLNYNPSTGLYQYLNNTTGRLDIKSYDSSGNLLTQAVRHGQAGSDVLVQSMTYTSHNDSNGNTVTPIATSVSYSVAGNTSTGITTSYAYVWYNGSNQMQTRTTTLPIISTVQNGSGIAATIVEQFDTYGNLTQRTDERGFLNQYTTDVVLSRITNQVLNYQSGVSAPGVNVTSDFNYDSQGRLTQTLGPSHAVVLGGTSTTVRGATWNVYLQSTQPTSGVWDVDQTCTGQGYATGTGPSYSYTLINPVSINKMDKDGRSTDQITSVRSSGSGALSPTDVFNQSDWQSWNSAQYDTQHRSISSRVYFLIPSSGTGTVGTNYGQINYGYDALERQNRVVDAGGTITRTVWTCLQWVDSKWVGTNDTGATDSNPAGAGSPNNMVIITQNQYDSGDDGGDGNLTQQTQYLSATSGDTRITNFGYDFRDRRTSMTDAIGRYTVYLYDNLGRSYEIDGYNVSGGTLFSKNTTSYDDRNRVYQTSIFAVDPVTGTLGNALIGNTWYDASGNTIQQIAPGAGQVFAKSTYNGVGWVTGTYLGYNTTGTNYNQAGSVIADIIVTQSIPTYTEVGNIQSQAIYERLNDTSASIAGALTPTNSRVSYNANWFDGIDRSIARGNYGALSSAPTVPTTPPASSGSVLISAITYDNAGRVYQVTDPKGIVNETTYDAAGRTTQTIEDVGSGKLNRTTNSTYTLDNLIANLTAVNSTTGNQVTTYTYGTSAASSYVVRNDLLASVTYPDSVSASDVVSYAYNRQGQMRTTTDQRGTVHTFYFDKLGRRTNDCVTSVGSNTSSGILQIASAYEIRGMVQTVTSYDSATQNSGTTLNELQMAYNTFGQLVAEQQSHAGNVSGSSPVVTYNYSTGASSSNQVRPISLTYPNGRVISLSYGTAGGMDDYLSRISAIMEGSTSLASYSYLGSSTVINIEYGEPGIQLDLWGGTTGVFSGLDLFNRIIDQRWET